jgi:acyl carrier protein
MTRQEFLLLLDDMTEAKPGTLTGAEDLRHVVGWDSMAVIRFIALVDEHFHVSLAADQIARCKTVGDLIALLGDGVTG